MSTLSHIIAIVWLCAVAPALGFIINPFRFAAVGGGGDPYFSNVVLLLHFDGSNGSTTITDSSSYANTITCYNGAALTTTAQKFGSACSLTDGLDDYVSIPASANYSFGTATDFTVEFWMNIDSSDTSGSGVVMDTGAISLAVYASTLYVGNAGGNIFNIDISSYYNTWAFFMFRRVGSTFDLYINGVNKGTTSGSYTYGSASQAIKIGYAFWWGVYGKSKMDDLRITNGVGRANNVPTAAFPDS